MAEAKRGALLPENAVGGGQSAPDGEYIIKNCTAMDFSWGDKFTGPAIIVLYQDVSDPAVTYEEPYSLGKTGSLHESGDGKRVGIVAKNSNAFQWLGSLINAGFPKNKMEDDVTVFDGTRVILVNKAQPKLAGLKDQVEGKTIGIITKIVALPGQKAGPKALLTRTAAPSAATSAASSVAGPSNRPSAASTPASAPSAPAAANGNADLTPAAIEMVQAILAEAPDNTITRVKLSTQVMLRATKDPMLKPNMLALKKLAGDPTWLVENSEGNWETDGEEVKLA